VIPRADEKPERVSAPAKAKLVVELPADAKLYIDDHLMKTTSARRTFSTPALEADKTYYYVLRAEIIRDGKTLSDTKRVIVRAGNEIRANFEEPQMQVVVKERVN
jgi:uncharacterized protein (TIGR03000 family)